MNNQDILMEGFNFDHFNPFVTIFLSKYTTFVSINLKDNEEVSRIILSLLSRYLEHKLT